MISTNMAEKAMIYKYILATTQVIGVIDDAMAGKLLTDQQCDILDSGVDLLSRIIEGATLVEGKGFKNGLTPTMEGLSIYGYALSTIGKLDSIKEKEEKGFTEFFEKLRGDLVKLIKQKRKGDLDIMLLNNFFLAIVSSFRGDIQKEIYKGKTISYDRKPYLNESIFA